MKKVNKLQAQCFALYILAFSFSLHAFGRPGGMQVQGATGFGPNFSRMRSMERNMGADLTKMSRAPRADVLTTPQISCGSDSAVLAEIKQCVCQLKNLVESCACSQGEEILNELNFIVTKVEALFLVAIDTLFNTQEIVGTTNTISSNVDLILVALGALSSLDSFVSEFDVLISQLDTLNLGALSSLTDSIVALNSSIDGISSKIDVDINLDLTILSVVDKMDTQLDVIESLIANPVNCCSTIGVISSVVDEIVINNTTIISLVDKISTQVDSIESFILNVTVNCSGIDALTTIVESIADELTTRIDADIAIDQTILSVVDKLDTQLDLVESIVSIISEQAGSSNDVINSNIDNLASIMELVLNGVHIIQSEVELLALDLSLIPVIDSKTDVLLFNVGSRSDFAFSKTAQLSTIDQINALDLTVIALLKTVLADLHGL